MTEQYISCDVCRDLIPLVRDEVASEDSVALVREHVAHCPACLAELGEAAAPVPSDGAALQKVRRAISLRVWALVALGVALGLSLRLDESFLYNLFFMPAVGALLYLFGGKKWYFGPCVIAAAGGFCRLAVFLLTGEGGVGLPEAGLCALAGLACGLLALLGGGIAALFRYAFGR